ncbi:MAG: RagB/SusD family nutrient uptake outer membrane protein [Gemmatimonadetes bacterium]|nr:RagB/SusD family nutrient uptake outer membrane protein [Gemmatimonadota bacterium]MYA65451.1 RagB/SusD family nutrient uptake outer membrane protein [Gemmatimonadota bacterium]MYB97787.1 RagB/SusD family nutrient uptake outer membrane protein [Gemmatimonadota bacterium]MYH53170.1 RagB/SusD family nutrient uptake outer membrane protein [Gemmatimonadota bacterium]MYK66992.1 RagB/SusD family nutrient uptake outer membrane protein [Gemmatimonadota bacterium]
MRNTRLIDWKIGVCAAVVALSGACVDLNVTNLNDPDRERALSSGNDVESLISGGFQAWWQTSHHSYPAAAMSTAADAHSSSWGNWGMRDAGWEPRKSYNNDPAYSYNNLAESPWLFSYRTLAAVRDGLLTLNGDTDQAQLMRDELGAERTERLNAFAKYLQAMSLANLALIFDQAFIVDESVDDIAGLEMQPYTAVWAAAEQKFAEVIQMASGGSFVIPAAWVAFNRDWSAPYMAELARAYRARFATQIARTPSERDGLDWSAILADASGGLSQTFAGYYEEGGNWAWARAKHHTAHYTGWARIDYRTVGPSDASGKWEEWINASADAKRPFDIDTDDRRITAGDPKMSGTYIRYMGNSPFPADRGIYHYSNYIDWRWRPLFDNGWVGEYPDMTAMELEFIAAEANYRLGNRDAAMETVNKYRARGELPPFTDANGVAPGGDRCVPQMADGSCGTLWDALKYEKRVEVFHYGFATEYFDDRGWGDLVEWTWEQVPVPGSELLILLMDIYSFGGPGGNSSAGDASAMSAYLNNTDMQTLTSKLFALRWWDRANLESTDHEPTRH